MDQTLLMRKPLQLELECERQGRRSEDGRLSTYGLRDHGYKTKFMNDLGAREIKKFAQVAGCAAHPP